MTNRPNILLVMTDQHRADALGASGHPIVQTPTLDCLASEGVLMSKAYCTTPLCVPSRTTLFSGQHAARHALTCGTGYENKIRLDSKHCHLPGILREQGYTLALVGKNHAFTDNYCATWDFCEMYDQFGKEEKAFCSPLTEGDRMIRRWRSDPSVVPAQEGVVNEPQPGQVADDPNVSQTEHALRFLHERDRSAPFFLYLSYESPHFPNVVPEPFYSMYRIEDMPGPSGHEPLFKDKPLRLFLQYYGQQFDRLRNEDYRRIQASYLAQISLVDMQIGRVFDALRKAGDWEQTLVVFVSDHGDFFGNHGLVGKTNACYEDLLHVPMVWHLPGGPSGVVRDGFCNLSDVMPTILDFLGTSVPEGVQGRSLLPVIHGEQPSVREHHIAESHLTPGAGLTREGYLRSIENRATLREAEGRGWFGRRQSCWVRSIQDSNGMKLITNENDTIELYDLSTDPEEHTNLYASAEGRTRHADIAHRLLDQLESTSYR